MSQADATQYSTVNLRLQLDLPSHHHIPTTGPSTAPINSNTHTVVKPIFFKLQPVVVGEHISNTLSSEQEINSKVCVGLTASRMHINHIYDQLTDYT